jgi:hypothetical protein
MFQPPKRIREGDKSIDRLIKTYPKMEPVVELEKSKYKLQPIVDYSSTFLVLPVENATIIF